MNRIRWERVRSGMYKGILGEETVSLIKECFDGYSATFLGKGPYPYSTLSSAKRGAERMLQRFLADAGLEVRHEYLGRIKMGEVKG